MASSQFSELDAFDIGAGVAPPGTPTLDSFDIPKPAAPEPPTTSALDAFDLPVEQPASPAGTPALDAFAAEPAKPAAGPSLLDSFQADASPSPLDHPGLAPHKGFKPVVKMGGQPESTFAGAAGRAAAASALPTAGAVAGGLAGGKVGFAVGSFAGPVGSAVGALVGGIGGSLLAGGLASKAQDFGLHKILGDQRAEEINATLAKDRAERPVASFVGEVIPQAIAFKPSLKNLGMAKTFIKELAKETPERAAAIMRTPAGSTQVANLINVGLGAATLAGLEAYRQYQEGDFNGVRLAGSLVAGAVLTEGRSLKYRAPALDAAGARAHLETIFPGSAIKDYDGGHVVTMANGKSFRVEFRKPTDAAAMSPQERKAFIESAAADHKADVDAIRAANGNDDVATVNALRDAGFERAGETAGDDFQIRTADGAVVKSRALVSLVEGRATKGVLTHEVNHAIEQLAGVTDADSAAIDARLGVSGKSATERAEARAKAVERAVDAPYVRKVLSFARRALDPFLGPSERAAGRARIEAIQRMESGPRAEPEQAMRQLNAFTGTFSGPGAETIITPAPREVRGLLPGGGNTGTPTRAPLTAELLRPMSRPDLNDVADTFGVAKTGKNADVIARILAAQMAEDRIAGPVRTTDPAPAPHTLTMADLTAQPPPDISGNPMEMLSRPAVLTKPARDLAAKQAADRVAAFEARRAADQVAKQRRPIGERSRPSPIKSLADLPAIGKPMAEPTAQEANGPAVSATNQDAAPPSGTTTTQPPGSTTGGAAPAVTTRTPLELAKAGATRPVAPSTIKKSTYAQMREWAKSTKYDNGQSVWDASPSKSREAILQAIHDHRRWYNTETGAVDRPQAWTPERRAAQRQRMRDLRKRLDDQSEAEYIQARDQARYEYVSGKIASGEALPDGTPVYDEDGRDWTIIAVEADGRGTVPTGIRYVISDGTTRKTALPGEVFRATDATDESALEFFGDTSNGQPSGIAEAAGGVQAVEGSPDGQRDAGPGGGGPGRQDTQFGNTRTVENPYTGQREIGIENEPFRLVGEVGDTPAEIARKAAEKSSADKARAESNARQSKLFSVTRDAERESLAWAKSLPDADAGQRMNNVVDAPFRGAFVPGTITAERYGESPYVYMDQLVDPKVLLNTLGMEGMTYDQVVRMPTTQKYIEWYRAGERPPPVSVVFNDPAKAFKATNRRRVVAAIEAGITDLPARVELGKAAEVYPLYVAGKLTPRMSESGGKLYSVTRDPDWKKRFGGSAAKFGKDATESYTDTAIRNIVDKNVRIERAQEMLRRRGRAIPERADVAAAADAYQSKAGSRVNAFRDAIVDPLLKSLKDEGVTIDEIGRYVMAAHAPRRNQIIADRHPGDPAFADGGSGMTNAEAAAEMAAFQRSGKLLGLQRVADQLYAATDAHRAQLVADGLITQADADAMVNTFGREYVPLRKESVDIFSPGTGQGFSIGGREFQAATGRFDKADNPFVYALAQMETSIVRAEKNKVGQAFLNLVRANPDPNLWEIKTHRRIWAPTLDANGQAYQINDPSFFSDPNVVSVKENGQTVFVDVKDQLLARALKNLGSETGGKIVEAVGKMTRMYAQMITTWNPEFALSNHMRDVQTALGNMGADLGPQFAATMAKYVPMALKSAMVHYHGGTATGPIDSALIKQFQQDGGQIEFLGMQTVEQRTKDLESTLRRMNGQDRPRAVFHAIAERVKATNTAIENATRLAVYRAALDARGPGGAPRFSRAQAANMARNATVNFTKRGEMSSILNTAYLFFNASVQGNARMIKSLAGRRGAAVAGSIAALAAIMDNHNRAVAGDANGDGKNDYDAIPEFEKRTNFIVMKDDGTYFKIPLPYGYNVLHAAGRAANAAYNGAMTPAEAANAATTAMLGSFNPLGQESDAIQQLSPTILDPFVQAFSNTNWAGNPIRPEQFPGAPSKPYSHMAFSNASAWSKAVAQAANKATGGDEVTPGLLDVSPGMIQHWFDFATAGVGKFWSRTLDTGYKAATGQDVPVSQVPFARRVLGERSEHQTGGEFKQNKKTVQDLAARLDHYNKTLQTDKAAEITQRYGNVRALQQFFTETNARVTLIRKRAEGISNPVEKARLARVAESLQLEANKRFNRVSQT